MKLYTCPHGAHKSVTIRRWFITIKSNGNKNAKTILTVYGDTKKEAEEIAAKVVTAWNTNEN